MEIENGRIVAPRRVNVCCELAVSNVSVLFVNEVAKMENKENEYSKMDADARLFDWLCKSILQNGLRVNDFYDNIETRIRTWKHSESFVIYVEILSTDGIYKSFSLEYYDGKLKYSNHSINKPIERTWTHDYDEYILDEFNAAFDDETLTEIAVQTYGIECGLDDFRDDKCGNEASYYDMFIEACGKQNNEILSQDDWEKDFATDIRMFSKAEIKKHSW